MVFMGFHRFLRESIRGWACICHGLLLLLLFLSGLDRLSNLVHTSAFFGFDVPTKDMEV